MSSVVIMGSRWTRQLCGFVNRTCLAGARGGAVDRGIALQAGRFRVRFPMVSLALFIDNHSGGPVPLASTQSLDGSEYKEYFLGVKETWA